MRQVQVIPLKEFRLYGAIVAKEIELARRSKGTFRRGKAKEKDRAKWKHKSYNGWVNFARGMGEIVEIEVRSKKQGVEWQLLQSILGFLDRHFEDKIRAINIQYE
jgi:hypothetical protein